MDKTLNFLKKLHSDLIDGIESGVNTEDEKAEVFKCIEELESNTLMAKQSEIDKFKDLSINRNNAKSIFMVHSNNEDNYIKVGKRQFDKLIDVIYDSFQEREIFLSTKDVLCNDCIYYLSDNGNFPLEPCTDCSRFYADKFVRK